MVKARLGTTGFVQRDPIFMQSLTCRPLRCLFKMEKRYVKKAADAAEAMMAVPLSTPAMVVACLSRTTGPRCMVNTRPDLQYD